MTPTRFAIIAVLSSLTLCLSEAASAAHPQKKPAKQVKTATASARPTSNRTPATSTKVDPAPAPVAYSQPRVPSSAMGEGAALEVRGQSRNLSMMLVLKNKKREIDFVKPRENYSREVQNTSY